MNPEPSLSCAAIGLDCWGTSHHALGTSPSTSLCSKILIIIIIILIGSAIINNIFTSINITVIVFILTTSLSELKPDGTQLFLVPLSLFSLGLSSPSSLSPLSHLFHPSLLSPQFFSAHPNRSISFKVLHFSVKCLEIMHIMICCNTNKIKLNCTSRVFNVFWDQILWVNCPQGDYSAALLRCQWSRDLQFHAAFAPVMD